MQKKKVFVFFGGKSFEHDVSILTGIDVCMSMDSTKYDVYPVYIDINNKWWFGEELLDKGNYPLNDYSVYFTPPSTLMTCPLINDASSDAKKK